MLSLMWRTNGLWLALASTVGLASCASLPEIEQPRSAASRRAKEAPPARVTEALSTEPPLPDEPAEGWSALDDVPRVLDGEEHRHHAR
jgi:hypothetical protein